MGTNHVAIGKPVRPEGILAFGTIGCIAERDGVLHLVTCDHVINSFPPRAEVRVELYPRHDRSLQEPLAVYDGLTLALPPAHLADLAAAPISNPNVSDPARLPAEIPGGGPQRLSGVVEAAVGMDVVFWGARSAGYQRGRIVAPRSEERLPHPGYGLQKFELQLAMQIDPTDLPDVGDSGGPILTVSGELVGFLAGGPLACRITPPGKCIAYGVPAASALEGLGLAAIVMEKEDPDENR